MKIIIYSAAFVAALATVLSTRVLIPALILVFKAIEMSFAPQDANEPPVLAPVPVAVTDAPTPVAPKKPRAARRRKPSAKTLARAEAVLA